MAKDRGALITTTEGYPYGRVRCVSCPKASDRQKCRVFDSTPFRLPSCVRETSPEKEHVSMSEETGRDRRLSFAETAEETQDA